MKNVAIEYDPINIRWTAYHSALKKFFDKTAMLPDLPKNDGNSGKNVKVIYATPSSAFMKYVVPMVNGLTQYPIISFYLSEERTSDEVTSMLHTYSTYKKDDNGNYTKISYNYPIVKELTYNCDIFTTKMSDSDYIMTLLEIESNKYKPYSCIVNGRPVQYYIDNVKSGDVAEFQGKKLIHCTFNVNVPRAIISPAEIETDVDVINKIKMYLYGETDEIQSDQ